MLYALLFSFYIDGQAHTFHVDDFQDLQSCKAKSLMYYKAIIKKPDHIMCARKA